MRKKILGWLVLMAVPITCTSCQFLPEEEALPSAPVVQEYEIEEYEQATVKRGDLVQNEKVTCTYMPAKEEQLSFPIGGAYIENTYVSAGQQVQAGDLLAELESDSIREQISSLEYEIQVQTLQKSHLKENKELELMKQDALIADIQAQLAEISGRKEALQQELQQIQESQEADPSGEVQGDEKDPADTGEQEVLNAALEELESQEASLTGQKQQQEVQKSSAAASYDQQIQSLEDSLYIKGIRLEELKAELKERQLYAGIDGTITYLKETQEGERSVKGLKFVTVSDMESVVFTVEGEYAQYFPVGTEVIVTCMNKEYEARAVEASSIGLEPPGEEETAVAYLKLDQPNLKLDNGIKGYIQLVLEQRENVLYVDKDAVKTANGEQFVYKLDENGMKVMYPVTTGMKSGNYIEITSGLDEGDSVIVD